MILPSFVSEICEQTLITTKSKCEPVKNYQILNKKRNKRVRDAPKGGLRRQQ